MYFVNIVLTVMFFKVTVSLLLCFVRNVAYLKVHTACNGASLSLFFSIYHFNFTVKCVRKNSEELNASVLFLISSFSFFFFMIK